MQNFNENAQVQWQQLFIAWAIQIDYAWLIVSRNVNLEIYVAAPYAINREKNN